MSFLSTIKEQWAAVPDKSFPIRVSAKLLAIGAAVVFVLAFALVASRRVEAQLGYAQVTLADFKNLEQQVSVCVPAPKKSKKR